MKPNLLITGASGFIGSHLIEEALAQGYNVFAAVRKSSKLHFEGHTDVHIIYLDYHNLNALAEQLVLLKEKFGRFNYIIHNAGITRANTIEEFNKVNNLMPQLFVQALQLAKNIPDRFLLISSMAAFGPGDTKSMSPITIHQAMNPISHYGVSKKAVSAYFLSQSIVPFTIVYPTAVYGPRDKDFIELVKLINKGTEPYLGLYKQILSMIHVKDLAFAVVSLLTKAPNNSQYIVSDNKNYNKKELGSIIKQILHKKTFRLSIPVTPILWIAVVVETFYKIFAPKKMPLLTREKIREISCANWSCDTNDVWQTLGTKPQFDLQTGMEQTIGWYKDNGFL